MSALTKIFVVLLVILSIVMAAGVVVWVNRQQQFNVALRSAQEKLAAADQKASSASQELSNSQHAWDLRESNYKDIVKSKDQENAQLRQGTMDRDTRIAELNTNLAQQTAASQSANSALEVAQKTLDTTMAQFADLRKSDLDLQRQYAEATFRINDLLNKYETTNKQWQFAEEQVTQLQKDNLHLTQVLHQAGVSLANPRTINGEPLVRLQGVIRSKSNVGGIPMATISLGSGDQVTKGMQFKLLDPSAKDPFLGYLIVDNVEPHESIGHLSGPRINEVRPGTEVRTQL